MTTGISAVEPEFDRRRAEAFAEKMIGVLNDAAIALLTSIGHQTGLFETLASLPPSTSERIAQAAGLNERYVREWLGGITLGRIVEYDPEGKTYSLPPEHAAFLTEDAGSDNLAVLMQYIALLGEVEQGIVDCFRNGGGLPYAAFPRFQRLQAEESRQTADATLLQKTLPQNPDLIRRLEEGIDVADFGCGAGHALNLMARAFPNSRFTGFDISQEGISAGSLEAREWGLKNVAFQVQDVAELDLRDAFDFITANDAIHDQVRPRNVLANICRALRQNGDFLMIEIAASSDLANNFEHPLGPTLFFISTMHCMTVSLAGGGEGLGTAWGEEKAQALLLEAGFHHVNLKRVDGDIMNSYYWIRKS